MMREPALSRAEWQAVAIALRDAEQAPPGDGLLARLARCLTGSRPRRPLADPRLEAIRAFAYATRRTGVASAAVTNALTEEGFSQMQLAALALVVR